MKKKRVWVWCLEEPKSIECYYGERTGNKIAGTFCNVSIPSKIRCPHCGKKVKPRVRECTDYNCWHVYIPAHKKWVKK